MSYIIPDGAVSTAKIAALAVTTAKIANSAVTATQIASGAVGTTQLGAASVATANIQSKAITQALLALRATGTTVAAGGVAISGSSTTFSTASPSPVDVTGLSVTITTTGRPVMLLLQSDGTNSNGGSSISVTGNEAFLAFVRGSTILALNDFQPAPGPIVEVPPSCCQFVDVVAAGTYTYKAQGFVLSGGTLQITDVALVAFEL